MSGLEALLMSSINDEIKFEKVFPSNYSDQNTLTELLIISKYLKKCGKGSLQHKNKIFYYRTYIPSIRRPNGNSGRSDTFSDMFTYNFDSKGKKYFLLFLYNSKYKVKNIEILSNKIFEILDNNSFEGHEIKIESCIKISNIFEKFKNIEPNLSENNQLTELNIINNSADSMSSSDSSININNNSIMNTNKKRIDTRMVLPKKKNKSEIRSIDVDDLTTIKESDTDLSVMFKQNIDKDFFLPQINKWKAIKIVNIIMCSIVFIVMIILLIFVNI
jgi:hypothetical protein